MWLLSTRLKSIAVYTEKYLMMMSSKPVQNMYGLIKEINLE